MNTPPYRGVYFALCHYFCLLMSNIATAQAKRLRAQREAYMARQFALRTSSKAITKREVEQVQNTVTTRAAAHQAANQMPQTQRWCNSRKH